jgi:hypothetical protein
MGQADWAALGGALDPADLALGVVEAAVITPPNGGGDYVFGFNSLDGTVTGAAGLYVDLAGFAPTGPGTTPTGGTSIRSAVRRVSSPNNTGFSPFLFCCAQGGPPTVNDDAYMLGLSDADPYKIMLVKGPMIGGVNPNSGEHVILGQSSAQYSMGDGLWHHMRLDAIVEPNGSVLLKVFSNDLALHPLDVPSGHDWQNVPGFAAAGIVDDHLRIITGSAPLWGGYCGFGFAVAEALNRRGAFDEIEALVVT